MFGEEDVLNERAYTKTLVCRSSNGIAYSMKAAEFIKKLKPNDECWKIIYNQVVNK